VEQDVAEEGESRVSFFGGSCGECEECPVSAAGDGE